MQPERSTAMQRRGLTLKTEACRCGNGVCRPPSRAGHDNSTPQTGRVPEQATGACWRCASWRAQELRSLDHEIGRTSGFAGPPSIAELRCPQPAPPCGALPTPRVVFLSTAVGRFSTARERLVCFPARLRPFQTCLRVSKNHSPRAPPSPHGLATQVAPQPQE
eukprot:5019210-Alexandrium_andersonii.AAC.3